MNFRRQPPRTAFKPAPGSVAVCDDRRALSQGHRRLLPGDTLQSPRIRPGLASAAAHNTTARSHGRRLDRHHYEDHSRPKIIRFHCQGIRLQETRAAAIPRATFVSKSGQLSIDAEDWMFERGYDLKHIPLQVPAEVHWSVQYICGGKPEAIDRGDGIDAIPLCSWNWIFQRKAHGETVLSPE